MNPSCMICGGDPVTYTCSVNERMLHFCRSCEEAWEGIHQDWSYILAQKYPTLELKRRIEASGQKMTMEQFKDWARKARKENEDRFLEILRATIEKWKQSRLL